MRPLFLALILGTLALATPDAQQAGRQGQAKPAPKPQTAAKPTEPQEIFCATMKTGLLCTWGTTSALGLTSEKRTAWLKAVNNYNRAVNQATGALQAEARAVLSPTQMAEVDRWFGSGMNAKINELLSAPGNVRAAQ
jgi:hypothetical protein